MIPELALILYSNFSKFPEFFEASGWFILFTSFVLFIVSRKIHYSFSQKSADILRPIYIQMISPFSFLFGSLLIYSLLKVSNSERNELSMKLFVMDLCYVK
jgi:hypothetical protein